MDGEDPAAGAIAHLAELAEHLASAAAALAHLPEVVADHPARQALALAGAAVDALGEFAAGLEHAGAIRLERAGARTTVVIAAGVTVERAAAWIAELRAIDRRFLAAAELLGVVLSLAGHWLAARFAPPVVLHTLARAAPRLRALAIPLDAGHPPAAPAQETWS